MEKSSDGGESALDSGIDFGGEPVNDQQTSVGQLRDLVRQFVRERDWEQFHSPKNLSMSLAIEAGELMEHFQWIDSQQSRELTKAQIEAVGEELADVLCYGIALANQLEIDLSATVVNKMHKNQQKYPAEQFRGRFGYRDPHPPDSQPSNQNQNPGNNFSGESGEQV
jgi:dCTP diphosphatase